MVCGRQHIDVVKFRRHRDRAHHLRAVHEDDRSNGPGQRADPGYVGAVTGRRLHSAERHNAGGGVDTLIDVVRVESTSTEGDLSHVVASMFELAPREVV
jgi:hypothetical protein